MIVKYVENKREDRMTDYMIFGFGVGAGIAITNLYIILANRCEHDWEDIGGLNVYGYGDDKFPVEVYDVYKCKKCKENRREKR